MTSFLQELCSSIATIISKELLTALLPNFEKQTTAKVFSFEELNALLPNILCSCSVMSAEELAHLRDFIILCVLLTCYEEVSGETKHLIMQRFIPEFTTLWSQVGYPLQWLEDFWHFAFHLSRMPLTEYRATAYLFFARIIPIYFPWLDQDAPDLKKFHSQKFDLRLQPDLESFLLGGLEFAAKSENDEQSGLIRSVHRQTLYVTKQIIKFSHCCPASTKNEGKFIWSPEDASKWLVGWRAFFELYEVLQEPQLHLIEPHLSKLSLLFSSALGLHWWKCILKRALSNNSVNVRKRCLEVVMLMTEESIGRLACEYSGFVMGDLLDMLDHGFLYRAIDNDRLLSPFGEAVAQFYGTILKLAQSEAKQNIFTNLLEKMCNLTNNQAILYLLYGLSKHSDTPIMGDQGLRCLQKISAHKGFHNADARKLMRTMLVEVFVKFAYPSPVSFDVTANTLSVICEELELSLYNSLFAHIKSWLLNAFPAEQLEVKITEMGRRLFVQEIVSEPQSAVYGFLCALMLYSQSTEEKDTRVASTNFSACCKPLFEGLAVLCDQRDVREASFFPVVRACRVFSKVNEAVIRVTAGSTSLLEQIHLDERLFTWLALIAHVLCLDAAPPSDSSSSNEDSTLMSDNIWKLATANDVQTLLGTFETLGDSVMGSEMLIQWLDIILLRCTEWLSYHTQLSSVSFGRYWQQLHKLALSGIMSISLKTMNRLSLKEKWLLQREHVESFMHLRANKTLDMMTEDQIAGFGGLGNAITANIWWGMTYIGISGKWQAMTASEVFEIALKLLQDSRGSSTIAIFGCLQTIIQSGPSFHEEPKLLSLVQDSVNVVRVIIEEAENSTWAYDYCKASFEYLFQPALLSNEQLVDQIVELAMFIMEEDGIGERRRGVVPLMIRMLNKWFLSPAGQAMIKQYWMAVILALCKWGPIRSAPEEKLASILSSTHLNIE